MQSSTWLVAEKEATKHWVDRRCWSHGRAMWAILPHMEAMRIPLVGNECK